MPLKDPVAQAAYAKQYRIAHRAETLARVTRFHKEHPERAREIKRKSNLWCKYGLRPETKEQMLEAQNGRCAICLTLAPGNKGWCVDHDHKTGKVRALLCQKCNRGLGFFRDSSYVLQQAIDYLGRFV